MVDPRGARLTPGANGQPAPRNNAWHTRLVDLAWRITRLSCNGNMPAAKALWPTRRAFRFRLTASPVARSSPQSGLSPWDIRSVLALPSFLDSAILP